MITEKGTYETVSREKVEVYYISESETELYPIKGRFITTNKIDSWTRDGINSIHSKGNFMHRNLMVKERDL